MVTVTMRWVSRVAWLALLAAGACSSSSSSNADPAAQESTPDSGADPSASSVPSSADGGEAGAAIDSGSSDAASPADGGMLGTLSGSSCGLLRAQLASPDPSLLDDDLAFVTGETFDKSSLSPGGQILYDTANAGGSSYESETMSYEVLRYCEGAAFLKTETQILYAPPDDSGPNTITDLLVEIDGKKVGVSVTRVYKPSSQPPMTDDDVKALLVKKLEGINRSSERVLPADKWVKQVLHVFAATQDGSDAVTRVWPTIDAATRADTIVLVTHTAGGGFIYCNPDPPLGSECP